MINQSHNLSDEELSQRIVDHIDIVNENVASYKYKESEDPKIVTVTKTIPTRGPLRETWLDDLKKENIPVMCSYKIVKARFEVWGLQTRIEAWAQKVQHLDLLFYP